jgi:hypothetical protein
MVQLLQFDGANSLCYPSTPASTVQKAIAHRLSTIRNAVNFAVLFLGVFNNEYLHIDKSCSEL